MNPRLAWPCLVVLGVIAGCRSTPLHLYTLSPAASSDEAHGTVSRGNEPFIIERIQIPREVDRSELIVRTNARELVLLENDTWAAPLREEVRAAITQDLAHALVEPANAEADRWLLTRIRIDIREWEATSQGVTLAAEWQLKSEGPGSALNQQCEGAFAQGSTGTADDLVRADQRLMEQLAQAILHTMRKNPSEGCAD